MLNRIRNYVGEFRAYHNEQKQVVQAAKVGSKDLLVGRIVRYVHSIEKGLSIESPRPEFGYDKIKTLYGWIKAYLKMETIDKTCVYMAADALSTYCAYHESIKVSSDKIKEIEIIASELQKIKKDDCVKETFGGVQTINKSDLGFDLHTIEKLYATRHSVRQFSNEPISKELICKAVELAQSAPSACNRQAVRAYVIDAQKFINVYPTNLAGVGGFIENSDKVIIITGKISSYEKSEYKQFIVSAGIFTGYLTLALHGLGLGACIVQRSLRPDASWQRFCQQNGIPMDEQVVCLVVVGHMKEKTVVPVSNRFDIETILKWM